ncbi:MAG: alpha-amylase/4-alpha-glucanotransferase domain-containing protein, partial [Promethearchaeota archaeon]
MTDKSIFFPMIFHFHQPVDNFEHVIEDCHDKSYGPLIDTLFKHSKVKAALHFSGNLLEWFIKNKPEFVEKLKLMAERKQIEIIGGGYYEPIYAIIPMRDKIAQMRKLSHLIEEEFGLVPQGAWLSERVWEPTYPSFLNEVGLKYVIVDDNHFRSSGITQDDTFYSYITEDEGKTLRIFPINEELRYLTPWKPTYMAIDYLRSVADEKGDKMALLISDAEKMGIWGSTHKICYVEGYGHQEGDNGRPFLPTLFKQVEENDWIKSITLSEYMKKHPAKGLVYLPTASYDKMEEWVLPTEVRRQYHIFIDYTKKYKTWNKAYQFLKGGFWRFFLVKYPESNNMHKKMLYVREKLLDIERKIKKIKDNELISVLKPKVLESWDEIYKSQCNDCYWHGLFGGVYLQFLRFSVYSHLINAENLIDEMNGLLVAQKSSYTWLEAIDFTKNSKNDVLIESDTLNVYIDLSDGGTIFELDYKPKSYNLLNTLTRWTEAYHEEEKIELGEIYVDRFRRSMLRIRILHDDVSFEQLIADKYYEFGDLI